MRRMLTAVVLLSAFPAGAQVIEWNTAQDGQWNTTGNWNPANIPDSAGETARLSLSGPYTVTLGNNPNPFLGGLEVLNAEAILGIESGQNFRLEGNNLLIDGTMVLNSDLGTGGAVFTFQQDTEVKGTGLLRLLLGSADIGDAQLNSGNGTVVTVGPSIEVSGGGQIRSELINNGTISADLPGGMLSLDTYDKANSGVMRSTNGAELRIAPILVSQSDSGVLLADGGIITLKNGEVAGGRLETANGGRIQNLAGVGDLIGVRNDGEFWVDNGSSVGVSGGLINNGVISVNPQALTSNAALSFSEDGELGGAGEVVLVPGSDDFNDAQLRAGGDSIVTVGPAQTVRGQGRMDGQFVFGGRLEPGYPVGTLRTGDIEFTPTTTLEVQLAGDIENDFLEVFGGLVLDGRLEVALADGYEPPSCASWLIAETFDPLVGQFAEVVGPDLGDGRVWRIAYDHKSIELRISCYADFSPDCSLDFFDFLEFTNQFNFHTIDADCDKNGMWDLFDFLCFVNVFNAGC